METNTNEQTADIRHYHRILTPDEVKAEAKRAADLEWGCDQQEFAEQIRRFNNGDLKEKAKVYAFFEEINYHDICEALAEGDTGKANKLYYDYAA